MRNRSSSRKKIFAFLIPAYLFIFASILAENMSIRGNAFEFETTWWLWVLYISVIGYYLDLLFTRKQ